MKVLVTGGNGGLGSHVVPHLLEAEHHVVVGTRTPQPRDDGATEVAYHLDADEASLVEVLHEVDTVVHLASDPLHPSEDVTATERLVAALEQLATAPTATRARHLLDISIVGIDDHRFPYYRAKLACEEAVTSSSVRWSILRATQFHSLPGIFAAELGTGPIGLAPTRVPFQPVDVGVVAERVAALVDAGPSGRVRDLGGPEVHDFGDAMRRSLRAAGQRRFLVPMRLPAKLGGQEFRRGDVLAPGHEAGGRTFDDHLAEVAAATRAQGRVPIHDPANDEAGRDGVGRLLRIAGWSFLTIAAWMAVAPQGFVATVAGFGDTVDHFVRDLASFTVPLGVALILAASRPAWRRPVIGLALLQNGLHLVNHLLDIGTTDPAWHGPVNAALLAALQVALAFAFRAARPRPGMTATVSRPGAGSASRSASPPPATPEAPEAARR